MDNKVIYSNAVELKVQLFDAQIQFKNNNANDGDIETTTVVVSPQHLKVLSRILSEGVSMYEQQFGEIKIPEDVAHK